jgi:signal transduction histidine kinase/ligand-binding sensor domain-containing protein
MLSNRGGIIILITCLLISISSVAHIAFYHYGIERGLPEPRIISVSQDSSGFIWLAGEHSLYRFDGERYKTYRYINSGSSRLPFNNIKILFTDTRGILWAGSFSGLAYFDAASDGFIYPEKNWGNVIVNDLAEDHQGFLWAATQEGLARINFTTKETLWFTDSLIVKSKGKNVLPAGNISRIACHDDGRIWFSDGTGGLHLFNPATLVTDDYSMFMDVGFRSKGISKLQFANRHLFISTLSNGFYWLNPEEKKLKNEVFYPLGYTIHHFRISSDSIAWLTGNNGLFRFNYITGKYLRYTEDPGDPMSLRRSAVTFVYEDRNKNLWISSGVRGVDYGLTSTPFRHLSLAGDEAYQLALPEVTAIEFDHNGNMWLGYEAGFVEKHTHTPIAKKRFSIYSKNEIGTPGAIFRLLSDSREQLWLGGWETGLQKLNKAGTAFEVAPILPESLDSIVKATDIRGITEDSKGNIWVSFHGIGIARYEPETFQMTLFRNDPKRPQESLSNDWTYNLVADNNHNLWIATSHGVSKMNLTTGTFENFFHEEDNPNSLSNNHVTTVYIDPSGTVWAGTENGLNVFIPGLNTFAPVVLETGNTSYRIADIRSTKPGEIWASTQAGLIQLTWSWNSGLDGVTASSYFYNRMSGLLSTSYFDRSSAIDSGGMIYFGGNESIDFFRPELAAAYRPEKPVPVLTELTIDGIPVHLDLQRPGEKKLKLDHSNHMVSLRFTAPNYNNPQKQRFRYQLEGFDKQWNYTQYEQVANYTHLPPGEYTFRLETEDRNGNWYQNAISLPLIVEPPFWNTIPFYIAVSAAFLLLVFLLMYARSRIYLLRQKELEQLIEERTKELLGKNTELEKINQTKNKFFSIISHDLRSPFSGVLGLLELLADPSNNIEKEKQQELLELARNSAANTFELLENLLTWAHTQMKQTVSSPQKQNLSSLLKKNIELKLTTAMQKKISVHTSFPEELEASFDREMINTVIRNILNNAVKFTHPGGSIEVSAFRQNGNITVKVADNGIGIHPDDLPDLFGNIKKSRIGTMGEKGTGLGLIICKEFIEKNNGRIWATPNQPNGSIVQFTLPANEY